MALHQYFHMTEGRGKASYAQNSTGQKKVMTEGYSIIREALKDVLANGVPESMGIADLGCSSGPNTLTLISDIIRIVFARTHEMGHQMPEIRLFLNDLPANDFNNIFRSLPNLYSQLLEEGSLNNLDGCYISGVPGSFYHRLFPTKSLHFVHSSSSLHWLSQAPDALNKGRVYISKCSPASVISAYRSQFENDFGSFLKKRSEEMVSGGCMVLSFLGRGSADPATQDCCYLWDLLAQALMSMTSEGIVKEEKIDSFNVPYYAPSAEEVENEIEREGSFICNSGVNDFEIQWKECGRNESSLSYGQQIANTMRAVNESLLASHFGTEIMDETFFRLAQLIDDYLLVNTRPHSVNLMMSLSRK